MIEQHLDLILILIFAHPSYHIVASIMQPSLEQVHRL